MRLGIEFILFFLRNYCLKTSILTYFLLLLKNCSINNQSLNINKLVFLMLAIGSFNEVEENKHAAICPKLIQSKCSGSKGSKNVMMLLLLRDIIYYLRCFCIELYSLNYLFFYRTTGFCFLFYIRLSYRILYLSKQQLLG